MHIKQRVAKDGALEFFVNSAWQRGEWVAGKFAPLTDLPKSELVKRGYAVVSRKYKIIARTEPGWVDFMRKGRTNGGIRCTGEWADHYRRMYSSDLLVVRNVAGIPNSHHYLCDHDCDVQKTPPEPFGTTDMFGAA